MNNTFKHPSAPSLSHFKTSLKHWLLSLYDSTLWVNLFLFTRPVPFPLFFVYRSCILWIITNAVIYLINYFPTLNYSTCIDFSCLYVIPGKLLYRKILSCLPHPGYLFLTVVYGYLNLLLFFCNIVIIYYLLFIIVIYYYC